MSRLAIAVSLALAACSPPAAPAAPAVPVRSLGAAAPVAGDPASAGQDLFLAQLHQANDLGRLAPDSPVSLILLLADSSDTGAIAAAGASLRQAGLDPDWRPGDGWMAVSGAARSVDELFGVQVHGYRSPAGDWFYASARAPSVPAILQPAISGAGRITSLIPQRRPRPVKAVPPGGLKPVDLLAAYDAKPLRDQGLDGTGETVVFLEFDAFEQRDLDAFSQRHNLPPARVEVKGQAAQPASGETTMDIEVVHAIAPGARLVVYNHPSLNKVTYADILRYTQQVLAENPGAIFSISIGYGCDKPHGREVAQAFRDVYDRTASLGVTVFVASGDNGAFTCLENAPDWGAPPSEEHVGPDFLASLPGVTGVGGTRLSVRQDGSWYNETTWVDPAGTGGSGGAISAFLDMPPWQQGPGVRNQYSTGRRQVPDISADSDPASGAAIVIGGHDVQGGGTSQAAPLWAGMTALINQYLKKQGLQGAGFLNPALYALASAPQPYPPFHDVTIGTNMVYPATPGYDLATGLGTPDVWNLARDLEAYQRSGRR